MIHLKSFQIEKIHKIRITELLGAVRCCHGTLRCCQGTLKHFIFGLKFGRFKLFWLPKKGVSMIF